ncbi:MAG: dihydroneopterin aldolase [Syntrophomonas sp.]
MDRIIAKRLKFKGCHGICEKERQVPQEFWLDLELCLDLKKAGKEDDLKLTVDYDAVFHAVRKIVEDESYRLIEALAERVAAVVLARFPVQAVVVTVYKPHAPVEGEFDYFAVNIRRER